MAKQTIVFIISWIFVTISYGESVGLPSLTKELHFKAAAAQANVARGILLSCKSSNRERIFFDSIVGIDLTVSPQRNTIKNVKVNAFTATRNLTTYCSPKEIDLDVCNRTREQVDAMNALGDFKDFFEVQLNWSDRKVSLQIDDSSSFNRATRSPYPSEFQNQFIDRVTGLYQPTDSENLDTKSYSFTHYSCEKLIGKQMIDTLSKALTSAAAIAIEKAESVENASPNDLKFLNKTKPPLPSRKF
ncbi:hypothetical protein [uncultured Cohaesibacter sp.]|uniref:hypothetical protein n=1 Tax=uncultured Cohaesibacter sp. TaxID=1002546 RepID=UPI002AAC3269|nr:hypothetical protein [uncultured Cohaesibacter sp.]